MNILTFILLRWSHIIRFITFFIILLWTWNIYWYFISSTNFWRATFLFIYILIWNCLILSIIIFCICIRSIDLFCILGIAILIYCGKLIIICCGIFYFFYYNFIRFFTTICCSHLNLICYFKKLWKLYLIIFLIILNFIIYFHNLNFYFKIKNYFNIIIYIL